MMADTEEQFAEMSACFAEMNTFARETTQTVGGITHALNLAQTAVISLSESHADLQEDVRERIDYLIHCNKQRCSA
jgi:hypothetical protein